MTRMANERPHDLWESDAEARLLESRVEGFWNPDYFSRVILPLLDLKPGARILDVGAGTGALSFLLARLLPEAQVVGIDLTPSMVTAARAQAETLGIANVQFQDGDALALPFENDSFEAVVCQTLLIHLGDPGRAVREMARVLQPGGSFMAAEFHTLALDLPLHLEKMTMTDAEADDTARYALMLLKGYRNSGQGDFRGGSRAPFLALDAGLQVVDVRINDRVIHAFPPYLKRGQHAAFAEAQTFLAVFKDEGYGAWVSGAMAAGGGSESDAKRAISLFAERLRAVTERGEVNNAAFLWLFNPVLLVTVAQKPPR